MKKIIIGFLVVGLVLVTGCRPGVEPRTIDYSKEYRLKERIKVEQDVYLTVLSVGEYKSNDPHGQPEKGKEYYKITAKFENKSDEPYDINSLNFLAKENGKEVNANAYGSEELEDKLPLGDLPPGQQVQGSTLIELKPSPKMIYYQADILDDFKRIKIKVD